MGRWFFVVFHSFIHLLSLFVFERNKMKKWMKQSKINPKIISFKFLFHFSNLFSFSTHQIIHFIIFWNHNLMISIDEIIFIFSHRLMTHSSTFIHNNQNINFLFIIFVMMKIYLFMFHCVNFDSINNQNHWWIYMDNKNEYQYFHSHWQQIVDIINFFQRMNQNQI